MTDCLFCRIAAGQVPSRKVFEDDELFVFDDIQPKAPVHLLIIPKAHAMSSVAEMRTEHQALIGRMVWRAKQLAESLGIAEAGYRLVMNCRAHGGQEIAHLHLHLLGGARLGSMA